MLNIVSCTWWSFVYLLWRCVYSNPLPILKLVYFSLHCWVVSSLYILREFPNSSVGKETVCSAGDLGSIPGSGRSPGKGNGNPLQYSCLENPMDRGAWQATVHGVARVGHNLATKPPPEMCWKRNGYSLWHAINFCSAFLLTIPIYLKIQCFIWHKWLAKGKS